MTMVAGDYESLEMEQTAKRMRSKEVLKA